MNQGILVGVNAAGWSVSLAWQPVLSCGHAHAKREPDGWTGQVWHLNLTALWNFPQAPMQPMWGLQVGRSWVQAMWWHGAMPQAWWKHWGAQRDDAGHAIYLGRLVVLTSHERADAT